MAESVPVAGDRHFSDTHWRSLRYLNLYRFVLAGLLFIASVGLSTEHTFFLAEYSRQHISVTAFYLLVTTLSVMPMARYRRHFNLQLSFHVLVDIIVLTTLMYASGGLRGGVGILLLVVLAGAGLVGQGKLVLSYAAMATLAVLGTEVYRALGGETDQQVFFQAGLLSSGFFATAISARLLAKRMLANEELARLRGVALADQTLISQRVIEEMQDGVLVVSQSGLVRQHNPRAERMLGVRDAADLLLQEYSAELSLIFQRWQSGEPVDQATFSVAASGLTLRPHFVPTETSDRDVLVFLEDMGRVHERARQLKLAALGRLTANIAHEIRNPLSSISHASELLAEERREETQDRLLRIVKDNTQRLELIVRNVLELGRRDHIHREPIDLATFLPMFLDELCVKEKIDAEVIQLRMHDSFSILFDRAHLHQVLWNLLVNALRYSQRMPASVMIELHCDAETKTFELHLTDDGEGIAEGFREQVFEPFFTTHSRGTGLGLYIARELCEANSARIDLLDNAPGAHFRIKGRVRVTANRSERRTRGDLRRVLVVDDEADIRELLDLTLSRMGLAADCAATVAEAKSLLGSTRYHLCLTDMRMPDGEGLEIVRLIGEKYPQTPVAVITAFGSTGNAVAALKAGAFDYLAKPVALDQLRSLIKSALELPVEPDQASGRQLIGESAAIVAVREMIAKLARSQAPVYISGESGSGKELAARLIHAQSARSSAAFIPVNCGAIPESLVESEFFGYRKGAFTGADTDREGFFQAAHGGTLFLDEVADLPLSMQVKLLRAIQEKRVRKVGNSTEDPVDVRIISATHRNLKGCVEAGTFRQDLYYRLDVIELRMPALRERTEDVPPLVTALLEQIPVEPKPVVTEAAMAALSGYAFPGNVRELENILERATALSSSGLVDVEDLQLSPECDGSIELGRSGETLDDTLNRVERQAILDALVKTGGNRTAAARLLGVTFRSLRYRIDRLGIDE